MRVNVRKARKADAESIVNIWNMIVDEKGYTMGRDKYTVEEEEEYIKKLDPREAILIAEGIRKREKRKIIVGYCLINIHYKKSKTTHHVAMVDTYIVKGFRNQRIGTRLLNASLHYAKGQKFEKVINFIRASNEFSLKFYEKAGFKEVGRLHNHLKLEDGYEDWVITEKFV